MNCVICGKPILPGQTYMAPPPLDAPWHSPECPKDERAGSTVCQHLNDWLSCKECHPEKPNSGDVTYAGIVAAYLTASPDYRKHAIFPPHGEECSIRRDAEECDCRAVDAMFPAFPLPENINFSGDLTPARAPAHEGSQTEQSREEQTPEKTVEQSTPHTSTLTGTYNCQPCANLPISALPAQPHVPAPVSGSVAATCPVCGGAPCWVIACLAPASVTT